MKKYLLLFVLSAFLFPAALRGGEEGSTSLEKLQVQAEDPDSNVLRMEGGTNEKGEVEILYLDKKAFNEKPSRRVVLGREVLLMLS